MNLREYLEKYGIKQTHIAQVTGYTRVHVNNIVFGKSNAGRKFKEIIKRMTNGEVTEFPVIKKEDK